MAVTLTSTLTEELTLFRRTLHQHPELSLEEYETTRRIRAFLDKHGIEQLDYPLETGVLAVVRGKQPGPCVAVRADIDALPIHEETGLPYASQVAGKMHACGHDFHTACALGAAVLAKTVADSDASFVGSILFVFQPAEEAGVGANMVYDTGVFQDFQVGAIIGEHNNPHLEFGKIGVKSGPLMGSVDEFRIVIKGVGGHAAIPHLAVDPILVGANIVAGLQHVVSRAVSPLDSVVVTVGQFNAGTARNVIPPHAVLEGTVRCLQPEVQDLVERRFTEFVHDTAKAYGAKAEVEYERQLPVVVNDEAVASVVWDSAVKVVGADNVVVATPTLGGEDFAQYQQHLPGCFFWVGTGKRYGWHHPSFDVDERMISTTSQLFVEAALEWLRRNA
ncbi:M20 metallopeptidase family protein [Alicyclobacillus pomorum]|jgi:N-acetylcysteine deacetylase|uniref:M20 metallopeptidase family protein n=1 Tax=Alicyclobacillus pomorum TaxID=204470 RepID=UPI000684C416|nr:amidohydrolase [Alicyclobacillus pomorum]